MFPLKLTGNIHSTLCNVVDHWSLYSQELGNPFAAIGRKKCILVGHDWGGALGYNFSGKYPEMVSQYIVCNLPHPLSLEEQWKSSLDQVS